MHVRPGSSLCRKLKHFVSPLILIPSYLMSTLTLTYYLLLLSLGDKKKQNIRNKTHRTKGPIVHLKLLNCHTKLCNYLPFQFQPFPKLKLGISSPLKEIPCFLLLFSYVHICHQLVIYELTLGSICCRESAMRKPKSVLEIPVASTSISVLGTSPSV